MKKSFITLSILFLMSNFSIGQENETKTDITQAAFSAANSWLKLVDEGKYGESWEEAALQLKNAVSKENWQQSLKGILPSYGKMIIREVKSSTYRTSLPGAADGEYVVIIYETQFENKEKSFETVTPVKDKDGVWRVSGYFIK